LKYLRNFKKRSKLTKFSDFFAYGERATLSHQFEQRQYFNRANFSVNILQFLKDAVITVGVSFRLCSSFSVMAACYQFKIETAFRLKSISVPKLKHCHDPTLLWLTKNHYYLHLVCQLHILENKFNAFYLPKAKYLKYNGQKIAKK
jgi:hypothetical protein